LIPPVANGVRRDETKGKIMKRTKAALAVAIGVSLGAVGFAGSADASRCGAMPDGIVDLEGGPASGTWDSPGEVISFVVANLGPEALDKPGQTVKVLCQGAP
jgi:hypothetical protein